MKIYHYILICLFCFCCQLIKAEKATASSTIKYEDKIVKPIQLDEQTYDKFKSDKHFNYYDEKDSPSKQKIDKSTSIFMYWLDKILNYIQQWFGKQKPVNVSEKQSDITLWIIVGIVTIILIFIIIAFKPSLFYKNKKKKLNYDVEEETIYGINFNQLIKNAVSSGNYVEAIRWKYLQTLKQMQDRELISWNPNKTVTEYCYELKRKDLLADFKSLSNIFLYYRYGNFDAYHNDFDEIEALSNQIIGRL